MLNFRPEIECKRENYGNKKKVFYHDATILKMMTTLIFFFIIEPFVLFSDLRVKQLTVRVLFTTVANSSVDL